MQTPLFSRGPEIVRNAANSMEALKDNIGRIIGPSILVAASLVAPNANASAEKTEAQPTPSLSDNATTSDLLVDQTMFIKPVEAHKSGQEKDVFKLALKQGYASDFKASELSPGQKEQIDELAADVNKSIENSQCATITVTANGFASDEDGRFAGANLGEKSKNNLKLAYQRARLSKEAIMTSLQLSKNVSFNVHAQESVLTKAQIEKVDTIAKSNGVTRSAQLAAYNAGARDNLDRSELSTLDRMFDNKRKSTLEVTVTHDDAQDCNADIQQLDQSSSKQSSSQLEQRAQATHSTFDKNPPETKKQPQATENKNKLLERSVIWLAGIGLGLLAIRLGIANAIRAHDKKREPYGYGYEPGYNDLLSKILREPVNIPYHAKTTRLGNDRLSYRAKRMIKKSHPKILLENTVDRIKNLNVAQPPGGAANILFPIRTMKWHMRVLRHKRRISRNS